MQEKLESKADMMFEELGLQKITNLFYLYIDDNNKFISVDFDVFSEGWSVNTSDNFYLNKELLIAIHEKLKELGWLND